MLSASKVNAVTRTSSLVYDNVKLFASTAPLRRLARTVARSVHFTARSAACEVRSLRFSPCSIPIFGPDLGGRQHAQGAFPGALAYMICVRRERYLDRSSAAGSVDGTCVASAEDDTFETGR